MTKRAWQGAAAAAIVLILLLGAFWLGGRVIGAPASPAPPAPTELTAPVERRVLREVARNRGRVGTNRVAAAACLPGGADAATKKVFTRAAPTAGTPVADGSRLADVNGRPVLVLNVATPLYRDLQVGLEGPDVSAVQQSLARLGFANQDSPGRYGASTAAAVTAWYRSQGVEPNPAPAAQQAKVTEAKAALDEAQKTLERAQAALDEAARPPDSFKLAEADLAVNQARNALSAARAADDGSPTARVAVQEAELRLAQAEDARRRLRQPDLGPVTAARDTARTGRDRHRDELRAAEAATGPLLAACEVISVLGPPGVFLGGEPRESTDNPKGPAASAPSAGAANPDSSPVGNSHTDLLGTLRVSVGPLQIDTVVPGRLKDNINDHTEATITIDDDPKPVTATVIPGALTTDPGTGELVVPVTVPATDVPRVLGRGLRVTLTVATTAQPVLAVPVAAVHLGPQGTPQVRRRLPNATTQPEPVTLGLSADGMVEITSPNVREGDQVVVSRSSRP